MFNGISKKTSQISMFEKVDVCQDEEQDLKFKQIIEMLVSAGYYRARINGLENFDKIVGGMTWCIESCCFDVDIDLLFHENLTIGQKIALTEKIVRMLPKMHCPSCIEPHQILGLDCIHIFPVIQWLVKESIKTRGGMAEILHSFAVTQFYDTHHISEKSQFSNLKIEYLIKNITLVKNTYKPSYRLFKQKFKIGIGPDCLSVVRNALLEYGENLEISPKEIKRLHEIKSSNVFKDTDITTDLINTKINEKRQVEELTKNLYKFDDSRDGMSTQAFLKIMNLYSKEVSKEGKSFLTLFTSNFQCREAFPLLFTRSALENQKLSLITTLNDLSLHKEELKCKFIKAMGLLKRTRKQLQRKDTINMNMQDIQNSRILHTIKKLLMIYDELKNQENKFRDNCLGNHNTLNKMINILKIEVPREKLEENSKCNKKIERVTRMKLQLAKRNRVIATLTRQLDDVPGRFELTQYQRRFMELYNQVAAKHRETKQYYTLYNTLDDTKLYLSKEFSLLNSIQDNYNKAMTSTSGREQFIRQFSIILNGVERSKIKMESRCVEEKRKRDALSEQLTALMDQQRKYIASVKQLTIGCHKNEMLLSQLR